MKFSNLKVGTRLTLGFGVLVVAMALVGGMGMLRMGQLNDNIDRIVQKDWVKARLAMEIDSRARDNAAKTGELFLVEGDAAAKVRAGMDENRAAITKNLEELEKLLYLPEGKALHARIKEARAAYVQSFGKVTRLVADPKSRGEAARIYQSETMPALEVFMGQVAKLVELQKNLVAKTAEESAKDYAAARTLMIGIVLAALLAGVTLAFVIVRALIRQLGGEPAYAAEVVGKVASGDLTVRIETKANDKSSLLYAMKTMVGSLTGTVRGIKESTDTINTAAKEISQGNADLSQRTEEQASSLEETASSMEELTSTVKQNAENARQANQLAVGASDVAVRGGEVVKQVVSTMNGISESSKKIADIIGVIDGIAFQTNILALNAAVEAARAGEQGRGFAVVATEVRNLAQRSAAAAKEIKELITDSVGKVDAGSKLVDEAGKTMDEIVSSVKRVTDIMAEITAASQEQSSGIEQVNTAVTQMDEVTQQNAALVEQAAAAAESMEEQARNLAQMVAQFQLEQGAAAAPAVAASPAVVVSAPKPVVKNVAKFERKLKPKAAAPVAANEAPKAKKAVGAEDDWKEF
jgi:methyl-accepting chemotaxis protein